MSFFLGALFFVRSDPHKDPQFRASFAENFFARSAIFFTENFSRGDNTKFRHKKRNHVIHNFACRTLLYFFFDPLYFSFMNPKTDPKIGGRFDTKFVSRWVRIFVTARRRRKKIGGFWEKYIHIFVTARRRRKQLGAFWRGGNSHIYIHIYTS